MYITFFLCHLVSFLKRPATPLAPLGMAEYQSPDHEQLMKRLRPAQPLEEVPIKFDGASNNIVASEIH